MTAVLDLERTTIWFSASGLVGYVIRYKLDVKLPDGGRAVALTARSLDEGQAPLVRLSLAWPYKTMRVFTPEIVDTIVTELPRSTSTRTGELLPPGDVIVTFPNLTKYIACSIGGLMRAQVKL